MLKVPFIIITFFFSVLVANAGGVDSEYITMSEFIIVESGKSESLCTEIQQETLTELLNRKSHFVIAVKSFKADASGSSGFKADLVDLNGNSLSVTRFGIFPGKSFNAEQEQNYRRFFVNLPQDLESLAKNNQWCFKFELEPFSENQIYTDANAELRLEINHNIN